METIARSIHQGFLDLYWLVPGFLWWPAFFFAGVIYVVLFCFRDHQYYRIIWMILLPILVICCLLLWREVMSTGPHRPRGASGPDPPPLAGLFHLLLGLIVASLAMATYPLSLLVALTAPKGTDWRIRVVVGIGIILLQVVLFWTMFGKAAEYRDSYLKHHPDAAKHRLLP
jgi:hypothetical protein